MAKILNKCPICGGKLEYSALMQYALVYTITRTGALSQKGKKQDIGSMECGYIYCRDCDFTTDCDFKCKKHPNIQIWQEHDKLIYDDLDEV